MGIEPMTYQSNRKIYSTNSATGTYVVTSLTLFLLMWKRGLFKDLNLI